MNLILCHRKFSNKTCAYSHRTPTGMQHTSFVLLKHPIKATVITVIAKLMRPIMQDTLKRKHLSYRNYSIYFLHLDKIS